MPNKTNKNKANKNKTNKNKSNKIKSNKKVVQCPVLGAWESEVKAKVNIKSECPVLPPLGCNRARYGKDPSNKTRHIVTGCYCKGDNPSCSSVYPVYPVVNMTSPSTDGYSDDTRRCLINMIKNQIFYSEDNTPELYIKKGYYGFRNGETEDVNLVFGLLPFNRKFSSGPVQYHGTSGKIQYHYWLEDSNGLVYDHIDPFAFQVGVSVGSDMSKIEPFMRFKGLSKDELFESFGVWYLTEDGMDEEDDFVDMTIMTTRMKNGYF